jgi:cation transport ATPase
MSTTIEMNMTAGVNMLFPVLNDYFSSSYQGALLSLLFQISHSLEEKFTAKAKGSVERLFATIPTQVSILTVVLGFS